MKSSRGMLTPSPPSPLPRSTGGEGSSGSIHVNELVRTQDRSRQRGPRQRLDLGSGRLERRQPLAVVLQELTAFDTFLGRRRTAQRELVGERQACLVVAGVALEASRKLGRGVVDVRVVHVEERLERR